jgi:hypothetical protein
MHFVQFMVKCLKGIFLRDRNLSIKIINNIIMEHKINLEVILNFGQLFSIRSSYRFFKDDFGVTSGPTFSFYDAISYDNGHIQHENEFIRINLFKDDAHYHINPKGTDKGRVNVEYARDPKVLLIYLLQDKTLTELARDAQQRLIATYLSGEQGGKVDALVNNLYYHHLNFGTNESVSN